MKICILTHTFPRFDGDYAAPFMDGLASGMAEASNEVFVLTPFTEGLEVHRKNRKYKLRIYKYAFFNKFHKIGYSQTLSNDMKVKPIMYLLSPLLFIFGFISLYKLVKKEKIDIINAHWILPNGFIGAVVSILTGIPLVCTLPGSDVYMAKKNILFRWMTRLTGRVSAAVTSNSPQLLDDLTKIGVFPKKTAAIIYGVDPDKFKPDLTRESFFKKKYNIPENKVIILAVGRLVAKKGFVYLIKAAADVIKKSKNSIFLIIGEGDQRAELEDLIAKANLKEYFRLPGWADYKELPDIYNLADIFILPSIRDINGNLDDQSVAVVEAMSCGKPIITTDFPGYQIVVKNRVNGFLIPEKNSEAISRSITSLTSDYNLRWLFGSESRKIVLSKFTWLTIGKQYTNFFERLLVKKIVN